MIAVARAGETVDALCWRILGRTAAVTEQVLARNPGLADLGPVLPAGLEVDLPDQVDLAIPRRQTVKLWD
jgi:phage tail protein X